MILKVNKNFNILNKRNIENKIIFGDTFKTIEKLPNNFIDLLIVDPPYNLLKTYGSSKFKEMKNDEYYKFTYEWLSKIKNKLTKNASIYVCCDWKSSNIIFTVLNELFFIQNRITWQREKGRGSLKNWKNSIEDIWYATCSKTNYVFNVEKIKQRKLVVAPYKENNVAKDWFTINGINYRDTYPYNFWNDITIPYWSMEENTSHPTQKPEKLIAKLILASSNVGDFVFDCFLGSGTTCVVAKKLNRRFSGIEKEEEYIAYSIERLNKAKNNKNIQGYVDNEFWDRNTLKEQSHFLKREKND